MKTSKSMRGRQHQTTGEEKKKNQRITLIQGHIIKPLRNKNK
jgi:hypothetical protein